MSLHRRLLGKSSERQLTLTVKLLHAWQAICTTLIQPILHSLPLCSQTIFICTTATETYGDLDLVMFYHGFPYLPETSFSANCVGSVLTCCQDCISRSQVRKKAVRRKEVWRRSSTSNTSSLLPGGSCGSREYHRWSRVSRHWCRKRWSKILKQG